MRKADSLRAYLTAAIPALAASPDRLALYVDSGRVLARQSQSLSYTLGYTLKVGLWSFSGDPNMVFVPVLAWIAREQPQLLRRGDDQPFSFEAEILDSSTSDLLLSIDLTETVVVTPDAGGVKIDAAPEPNLADAFADEVGPLVAGFANLELMVGDGG